MPLTARMLFRFFLDVVVILGAHHKVGASVVGEARWRVLLQHSGTGKLLDQPSGYRWRAFVNNLALQGRGPSGCGRALGRVDEPLGA